MYRSHILRGSVDMSSFKDRSIRTFFGPDPLLTSQTIVSDPPPPICLPRAVFANILCRPIAVELRDVTFQYPARPTVTVLNSLNLVIQPGEVCSVVTTPLWRVRPAHPNLWHPLL
jgi:ABC-type multidrug transport system fused ATPase/permease subunit